MTPDGGSNTPGSGSTTSGRGAATGRIRDRILGQDGVLAQLDGALSTGRLAHAYLFVGPRGAGKTRTALAFAQQLLCGEPEPPCGSCASCRKVSRLIHPDLLLSFPARKEEAADPAALGEIASRYAAGPYASLVEPSTATIGIDQVRGLRQEVAKARVEGPRRVVLWSGADRMTLPAAQSSLKLVEEPPAETVLILTAEDLARLLPTLVSRCRRVRIRPLPPATIAEILERELGVEAAEARMVAALSGGSLGQAASAAEGSILELRDRALRLFGDPGKDPAAVARRVGSVGRRWDAATARRMVEIVLMWYHDLLMIRHGQEETRLVHADRVAELVEEAARIDPAEIRRRSRILEGMLQSIHQFVNPALSLHAALTAIGSGEEEGESSFLGG